MHLKTIFFSFLLEIFLNIWTWLNGMDRLWFFDEARLYKRGKWVGSNYWLSLHFQAPCFVYKCAEPSFLANRESRSRIVCDVYTTRHFFPSQLYLTKLLLLLFLLFNYCFASFVMAFRFKARSSRSIVGFLAETRITDVIVRPEVRIVAGKTSQKETSDCILNFCLLWGALN